MYDLYPYFTNDGSVGLYSPEDNDIYHSTYGALTEAYEKFIIPSDPNFYFKNLDEIKVLDICYGIGYNSKSFLNFYFEKNKKKFSNNHNIATIDTNKNILDKYNATTYTNNISKEESLNYNSKIYTNKIYENSSNNCDDSIDTNNTIVKNSDTTRKNKIFIKAIDTNKTLALLSPFIVCNKSKLPKNYKLPFDNDKISRLLNKTSDTRIKFYDEINVVMLFKIMEIYPEIFENTEVKDLITSKEYKEFFDPYICHLFNTYKNKRYKNNPCRGLLYFLHNIYYKYISNRYKKVANTLIFKDFVFELKIEDARKELLSDSNKYHLIFLDAFTPAKCPALWSIDFFKLLYEHLEDNGRILTYSNSAAVRNAFLNAGFYIGKIYNPSSNKFMGTIAVKNKDFIKYELSEYDLGLLKTKAGIFYQDKNLTGLNEEIIAAHKEEVEKSDLITSSKYIKFYKKSSEAL